MTGRTSQLQIRVSPEQKVALKRLAAAAGQNVSQYVLSRSLPRSGDELIRALGELRQGVESPSVLKTVASVLSGLGREELETSLASWSVDGMSTLAQNRLVALVEDIAATKGIDPPSWAAAVPSLTRPYFRWSLDSLRPQQLRSTRVAYKRRNIFDLHTPTPGAGLPPGEKLASLAQHLALLELDVEFYFVSGAVLSQAFRSRPASSRPRDLFGPTAASDPIGAFALAQGWEAGWAADTVTSIVGRRGSPGGFIDLPHLAVFQPAPAYALAVKLAGLHPEPPARELQDLRFLLRALNLGSEEGARATASRYIADRHLSPHASSVLRSLLNG